MKRTHLFFVLFACTLIASIMFGQENETVNKNETSRPFKNFVSRRRDSALSERMNEYRAKMDTLESKPLKALRDDYFMDLISEIAKQGDYESLELLEKGLIESWKYEFWMGVTANDNMEGAQKLLDKWAIKNPTVPMLMKYHPNGLNLMIETAENKTARGRDRVDCLRNLAPMPDAIKVLDRIKAMMSDQSGFFQISEVRWDPGIGISQPRTVGDVAAETVAKIKAAKKLQEK